MDDAGLLPMHRLDSCPRCGNPLLYEVGHGVAANLLCRRCGACWHQGEHGVSRVDPLRCEGCASRPICLAALAERSP